MRICGDAQKDHKDIQCRDDGYGNDKDTEHVAVLESIFRSRMGDRFKSNKRGTDGSYVPSPIDVSDVELPEEINALTEYIAENSHEEWAKLRLREGWTFAPETRRELKQSFDLVPYCELLDSEKDYDRKMAMYTLKVLYKLGCTIRKRPSSR